MPTYFYHLRIELCPGTPQQIESRGDVAGLDYAPAPGADIFKLRLTPHHSHRELLAGDHYDPADITGTGPLHSDIRLGRISIHSIDMSSPSPRPNEKTPGTVTGDISDGFGAGSAGFAAKGHYVPLEPRNTELGWGIVHLYRDAAETPGLYETEGPPVSSGEIRGGSLFSSRSAEGVRIQDSVEEHCTTLCILAVPSYLTPSDFLGFVGEKTRELVSHFRMIRTGRTNRYMVLMKFRSPKKARQWRRDWDGKAFISTEPETCHVVFVRSIQFQSSNSRGEAASATDKASDRSNVPVETSHPPAHGSSSSVGPTATLTAKPVAPPTPALIELPTCPVCLERMDETTGLLTILCQHVFHCDCLQKWRGSGCPVCRYEQGDGLGYAYSGSSKKDIEDKFCGACHSDANLWTCLICGNIGCGRYDEAHAFSHFEETSHCYAMDIDTKRVWDYAGDGYVHRLIENRSEGKVMDHPDARAVTEATDDDTAVDGYSREKVDHLGMEYTHLLTSQLDSQRLYFEQKVAHAADKAREASHAAEVAVAAAQQATETLEKLKLSHEMLVRDTIPSLEQEKARAGRRAEKSAEKARKLGQEWSEEKAMNENLMERVNLLGREVEQLKTKSADLEEQNRDLTFFISGQAKLEGLAMGEEVQEATVTVGDAPKQGKKRKGKGKGKA